MADLFGSKASNRGMVIYDSEYDEEKGIYSSALNLWCKKLGDLEQKNFIAGMEGLEKKAEDSYRLGGEMWPPSYSEFRALCFPHADRDLMAHKLLPRLLGIEDQNAKVRRYEEGVKHTSALLSMFSEEEIKQLTAEEIADNARLEKIRGGA